MVSTAYTVEHAPLFASPTTSPTLKPLSMPPVPLPMEALVLKESIRKTHRSKCFSFSLLHMRKMAVPPVQIPPMYRMSTRKTLKVGGHEVPYTRLMWERTKRATFRRGTLDAVNENGGIVVKKPSPWH